MIPTRFAGALRRRLLRAMGTDARQAAEVVRTSGSPFDRQTEAVGALQGYRYRLRSAQTALMLGMPGELASDLDSEWFMDLTPGLPVAVQAGDRLRFEGGDERRVSIVRGSGQFTGRDAYRLYKLEEV